jgi:AcrR family transcriptional regulator
VTTNWKRSIETVAETWRATAKAERRERYLRAAAELFAARGFHAVSIEELSAAAGVTGPALYRHFASKDAVLAELLIDASERLLVGATATVASGGDPLATLVDLVAFHVDFALSEPAVIRVQDRELPSLAPEQNRRVRSLQRRYGALWTEVLRRVHPSTPAGEWALRLPAVFGLLNATPYLPAGSDDAATRELLARMALDALLGTDGERTVTPAGPAPGAATG